ncbi:class I glutamine amidotransferase-like protein [Pyronema omphalodes]|nr:class I glutamine amidotransferase-like protein [Pyronema omphalodes]
MTTIRQTPPKTLIFLANSGQDPTEVAIPWSVLKTAGCSITFATEHGIVACADQLLLSSSIFATVLGATKKAKETYNEMTASPEFQKPLSWTDESFDILEYDIALLPGGHDKPIRQYLESESLHRQLEKYLPCTKRDASKPRKVLGAICHGVLSLAFARCPVKQRSLLAEHNLQTTTLPWWMEATAWIISQAWFMGYYYRTYPDRWCYFDVSAVLLDSHSDLYRQYIKGPINQKPFVHTDSNYHYVSARFPGDAELLAQTLISEARDALGEW